MYRFVRDDIRLPHATGERYLWVDSLCIVQDDPVDKQEQIGHMDASVTIATLAANSAYCRVHGIGTPRKFTQYKVVMGTISESLSPFYSGRHVIPYAELPKENENMNPEGSPKNQGKPQFGTSQTLNDKPCGEHRERGESAILARRG
ncbi:putative HET-domain-containing protein [Seiridium cardinale]|uniref:HET-domain-containing protein n=1 Tax=Seiridium cardinale TaxID=138064 RepID=A0ABR2XNJ5_9PEZI